MWNGPEKIKRNIATQDHDRGGLRMINVENFIISLKLSWIRRIVLQYQKWQEGFYSIIDPKLFFNTGSQYMAGKLNSIHNPFWKDVLGAWVKYKKSLKPMSARDILNQPLWYNDKCWNKTLFSKLGTKKYTVRKRYY